MYKNTTKQSVVIFNRENKFLFKFCFFNGIRRTIDLRKFLQSNYN